MAMRKLGSIYARFAWRTDRILTAFQTPLPANFADAANYRFIHDAGTTYLVNRLQVLWGEYCRNLIILSARGNAVTIGGNRLSPAQGIAGFAEIRHILGNDFGAGPRTYWGAPIWTRSQASKLNPGNFNQIDLGLGTAPVDQLKPVRNYLIHPNQNTRNLYQTLTQSLGYPGVEPRALLNSPSGVTGTVLESWIIEFQDAARNIAL